jgi:LuxR family maltose regulon positive regulatory protein
LNHARILTTKLFIPSLRPNLVARPRLLAQLDVGLRGPLTVLAAPAGWGKSTVLAAWCTMAGDRPVAWVSLDGGDNDPVRFWTYTFSALNAAHPGLANDSLKLLRMSQPPAIEAALTVLLNALAALPADMVLVLDDYHLITAAAVHTNLIYLLEHIPPQIHLVLATREDPPLPLARLRASRALYELRVADLRFTAEEAAMFLTETEGLFLGAEAVEALTAQTEGWIAGLQLAALSVQGRSAEQAGEFTTAFSGSNRYVVDYLVEEVLAQQQPDVQNFLLHTAVLDRFCAPLCDALLATSPDASSGVAPSARGGDPHQLSAELILERMERANLFLIPLDDEWRWHRYHHLFADALRSRLRQADPELYAELHRRASAWFERQDLMEEAVEHALAAADFEQAATLLDDKQAVEKAVREGRFETALKWLQALPEPLIQSRPSLCILHAVALTDTYQFDRARIRVRDAEVGIARDTLIWQRTHPSGEGLSDELRALQGFVAILRANHALVTGEVVHALALAREAFGLVPESDTIWRAAAEVVLALDYQVSGDVSPAAEQRVAAAVRAARAAADPPALILALLAVQGHIQALQGHLAQAVATFHEAEQMAAPLHLEDIVDSHFYEIGLGEALRQWNDLDAAERRLLRGVDEQAGRLTLNAQLLVHGYTALARLYEARGRHLQALRTLDRVAETAQKRALAPELVEWEAAVRAQLAIAAGDVAAAARWANSSGLSAEDHKLPFRREPAYLALARVRLAQGRDDPGGPALGEVVRLLDRLQRDAEAQGRGHSVLECLLLRALAQWSRRDRRRAVGTLARALTLAQPEGYVRLFADEGEPMARLLTDLIEAAQQGRLAVPADVLGYAHALVAACRSRDGGAPAPLASMPPAPDGSGVTQSPLPPGVPLLLDPLTVREVEVLHMLAEGASNGAIAAALVVTVGTVKKHVYHICSKLGVRNRTQAIARARALHLL